MISHRFYFPCPIRCTSFVLLILLLSVSFCHAQEMTDPDSLYDRARHQAFENKDYQRAIDLMEDAVKKAPDYLELQVFLARLFIWSDQSEKARDLLEALYMEHDGQLEVIHVLAQLEYWEGNYKRALMILEGTTAENGNAMEMMLLKANILRASKKYKEAGNLLQALLIKYPKATEARLLLQRLAILTSKNELRASYDFVSFPDRFDRPWHLTGIEVVRNTRVGPLIAGVNYAQRFGNEGTQYKIEMYPRLSETFYAYIGGALAGKSGVFPKYRGGFSLFANLPASVEADIGFRLLHFSTDILSYTGSIGTYIDSFWFNFRVFVSPLENGTSNSYALTVRHYFGGVDDYLSLRLGTGYSPDDATDNILLANQTKLNTRTAALGLRKLISNRHVLLLRAAYERIEYAPDSKGDQFTLGLGYIFRF